MKLIKALLTLSIAFSVMPYSVKANDNPNDSISYSAPATVEELKQQENTVQTSLSEKDFVKALEDQGFTVKKEKTVRYYRSVATDTYYTIQKPLTTLACPRGVGTVPGNHYINTIYRTVNGWNYFVSFNGSGVALSTSNYTKESENSMVVSTNYGGQGVTWRTTLQYVYGVSNSISVNAGWNFFGGSAGVGNTIYYRTGLVTEESSFNFPLMG